MRSAGRVFLRGQTFWIAYYLRGVEFRESAGTDDRKKAEKFLHDRLKEVHADEIGARTFTTPKASKLTVHDLLESLKSKFELEGKASAQNLSHLKRAESDFGNILAVALNSARIETYKKERRANGDKPATINRVLQMVREQLRVGR